MNAAGQNRKRRNMGQPTHLHKRIDRTVEGLGRFQQTNGRLASYKLRHHAKADADRTDDSGPALRQHASPLFLTHAERKANESAGRQASLGSRKSRREKIINLHIVFEDETRINILLDDGGPRFPVRQEAGDLAGAQFEGIGRLMKPAAIHPVDLGLGQPPSIDCLNDFAGDLKLRHQPFDLRHAITRTIQVDDEGANDRLARLARASLGSVVESESHMRSFKRDR